MPFDLFVKGFFEWKRYFIGEIGIISLLRMLFNNDNNSSLRLFEFSSSVPNIGFSLTCFFTSMSTAIILKLVSLYWFVVYLAWLG